VGVGATMSLQGAWMIVLYLQGHLPAEFSESAAEAAKSSDREILRFAQLIVGRVEYVQVFSPEFEQRLRTRYQTEIKQLTDMPFDLVFFYGETFSIFRLFLLLPAIYVVDMWIRRVPLTLHGGARVLTGNPVFISRSKTSFAYPGYLGVRFYTAFQDGTLLVSKAFADKDMPAGPTIVKYAQKASIGDTWADHQKRIAELEAQGKLVDRQTSFQFYAEISHKESAAW
jgi:hypothetical protein